MCRSFRFLIALSIVGLLPAGTAEAEMGGAEGRSTPFVGRVDLPDAECRFSIDVERVNFMVATVANKYRLVRMLIDCSGEGAVTLSAADDRLDMVVDDGDDGIATGLLSLRQSDGALWDAFEPDMRRVLAYPPEIQTGEPVYVFAYFRVEETPSLPQGFEFTIASLDETVRLRNLATAARN